MNIQFRTPTSFAAGALGLALGAGCPAAESDDHMAYGGCLSDAECSGDRICDQGACVYPEDMDSNTSESGGPAPSPGGSDGDDSGGDSGPAPIPGDSDGDSGTCSGDATQCEGSSSMSFCDDGQWQTFTCDEVCSAIGFSGASCSSDFCECGEPLDPECYDGTSAFCVCAESYGESCTNEMFANMYIDCYEGAAPEFACFAEYIDGDTVYCSDAIDACL